MQQKVVLFTTSQQCQALFFSNCNAEMTLILTMITFFRNYVRVVISLYSYFGNDVACDVASCISHRVPTFRASSYEPGRGVATCTHGRTCVPEKMSNESKSGFICSTCP